VAKRAGGEEGRWRRGPVAKRAGGEEGRRRGGQLNSARMGKQGRDVCKREGKGQEVAMGWREEGKKRRCEGKKNTNLRRSLFVDTKFRVSLHVTALPRHDASPT
jgi:hypothetical protein